MTDHNASGRFDVHATGELSGSFDSADERARLLQALNADHDLCSALLCGEEQLLCSGVEWPRAQAFAALMRDCGVVTRVVRHGESAVAGDEEMSPVVSDEFELELELEPLPEYEQAPADGASRAHLFESADQVTDTNAASSAGIAPGELLQPRAGDRRDAATPSFARPRPHPVYDGELVNEPDASSADVSSADVSSAGASGATASRALVKAPRAGRPSDVVAEGGGDIPIYLLEADARERNQRKRQQRRWGVASLLALGLALAVVFSGGEESLSSQHAYVHVLATSVTAGTDGVVAELLVQPRQQLQSGEAVAVIAAGSAVQQRHIEAAPAEGTVDEISVRAGQQVQRGDPLMTLALPGSAYLLAYFSAAQLRALPQRALVQIELDAYPGQAVVGRLGERGGEKDERGRRAVRIDFEDQQPLLQRLRSGMAASVKIRLEQKAD